jgi:hypothetical protein
MFITGMARLAAIIARLSWDSRAAEIDRREIECERCNEWPCVCGTPEFESFVSAELRKAEEIDR